MISPQNVNHVPMTAGTLITRMPFEPGAGAMLPGARLSASAESHFTACAGAHSMAPGFDSHGRRRGKREQSLRGGHSAHQPLRVRSGTTLGGQYAVGGAVGEFRGNAFSGSRRGRSGQMNRGLNSRAAPKWVAPTLLPHGQQQSSTSSQAIGSGMISSGGGGVSNTASGSMNSMGPGPGSGGHSGGSSGGHH